MFDYQQVVFGAAWRVRREDRNLGGLRLDRALRALEAWPDICSGSILEVGCGVGRFTAPLSAHLPTARLVAFDLSQAAVVEAARRGRHAAYAVANALSLPYADGTFDAVVFFDLLEHLVQPAVALAEFARVTQPGGLLHGYVPCEGQPPTLHWLLRCWVHGVTHRHAGHIQHYRHSELVASVRQAGFAVLDLDYSCHLLGQALDVTTFAVREVVFRRRRGADQTSKVLEDFGSPRSRRSNDRPEGYYDRSVLGTGRLSQIYGVVRTAIEAVTYAESRLLGWCPWASGVHLTAQRVSEG